MTTTMTPVEELRAAAKTIRESGEPVHVAGGVDVSLIVADWLDTWATFIDRDIAMPRRSEAFIDLDDITELAEPVFAVARVINGGAA